MIFFEIEIFYEHRKHKSTQFDFTDSAVPVSEASAIEGASMAVNK